MQAYFIFSLVFFRPLFHAQAVPRLSFSLADEFAMKIHIEVTLLFPDSSPVRYERKKGFEIEVLFLLRAKAPAAKDA